MNTGRNNMNNNGFNNNIRNNGFNNNYENNNFQNNSFNNNSGNNNFGNNMNFNDMMNMIARMDKKELQNKLSQAQAFINANGGPQAMMNKFSNGNGNQKKF